MKTLLLAATIWVSAQGKQPIKLTQEQYTYLSTSATNNVKRTLCNYKNGGTIRNNEAADQIFKFLGK